MFPKLGNGSVDKIRVAATLLNINRYAVRNRSN